MGSKAVLAAQCVLPYGRKRMEHLWSRAVAIGGNRWQMGRPREPLEQAKAIAVGCDQLPIWAHGKGALPPWYGGVTSGLRNERPSRALPRRLAGTLSTQALTGGFEEHAFAGTDDIDGWPWIAASKRVESTRRWTPADVAAAGPTKEVSDEETSASCLSRGGRPCWRDAWRSHGQLGQRSTGDDHEGCASQDGVAWRWALVSARGTALSMRHLPQWGRMVRS
jgi:hypothetical protein